MVGLKVRRFSLSVFSTLAILLSVNIQSVFAAETLLFEGYYRVLKSGQHVGYYIMRHSFDSKKKQFSAITFMQIEGDEPMTESIKILASEEFSPISYAYTAMGSGITRTIDAKAAKGKITGTIVTKGQAEKFSRPLPKNSIASSFLIYSILRSPQGLKPGAQYTYEALAEELAEFRSGKAQVSGNEAVNGIKAYRIKNDFLDTSSNNLVSETGEVLATLSPSQKIAVELVATPDAATGKFRVQNALLKSLFGDIPTGEKNILAQSSKKSSQ